MTAADTNPPDALAADFQQPDMAVWRQQVDKALRGGDFERRLVSRSTDGIRIEPLFVGRPAPSGVPSRVDAGSESAATWDIRQIHAEANPSSCNAAILQDLQGGATSILLQIAGAGQNGLLAGLTSMSRALDGVHLDVCPIAFRAGEQTPEAAASLIALWNVRGLNDLQRRGAFNFDPLGELAATGVLAKSLDDTLATASDLIQQTLSWPHVTALTANGHVWHAAGASEAQELAAILAAITTYLRAAEAAGVKPAIALTKIAVTLAVDSDQLMGLAKLRAVRILVHRLAEVCGATNAAASMKVDAETSVAMMSRRDPWVNMLRTTMACATAAIGGADSICVLPYTWALGQPNAFAHRMARNTSIVLMEESGLARVDDPAGGSFAVETLTSNLARAAWVDFQDIEARGGLGKAIVSGHIQAKIAATVQIKEQAVATGKSMLTGTSAFPRLGDDGVKVDPWPNVTDPTPPQEPTVRAQPLQAYRPTAPFEHLRDAAEQFASRTGQQPRVFLACLGPLASHAARATWIGNFLAAGGIAAVQSEPLLRSADAGRAFADSGATIAFICGADEIYTEFGEAAICLLKTAGAAKIYLAGKPKGLDATLKDAGVDEFVLAGCDMIETLRGLQSALGIEAPTK